MHARSLDRAMGTCQKSIHTLHVWSQFHSVSFFAIKANCENLRFTNTKSKFCFWQRLEPLRLVPQHYSALVYLHFWKQMHKARLRALEEHCVSLKSPSILDLDKGGWWWGQMRATSSPMRLRGHRFSWRTNQKDFYKKPTEENWVIDQTWYSQVCLLGNWINEMLYCHNWLPAEKSTALLQKLELYSTNLTRLQCPMGVRKMENTFLSLAWKMW